MGIPFPWTERDISGDEFEGLCAMARRGEIRMFAWGPGSSNGLWNIQYWLPKKILAQATMNLQEEHEIRDTDSAAIGEQSGSNTGQEPIDDPVAEQEH